MRMTLRTQLMRACVAMGLLAFGVACPETDPLVLQPVPNQTTQVGVEITIELLILNAPGTAPGRTARATSAESLRVVQR